MYKNIHDIDKDKFSEIFSNSFIFPRVILYNKMYKNIKYTVMTEIIDCICVFSS